MYCLYDLVCGILERHTDFLRCKFDRLREAGQDISSFYFHYSRICLLYCSTDLDLDRLCSILSYKQSMCTAYVAHDCLIKSISCNLDRRGYYDPAQ